MKKNTTTPLILFCLLTLLFVACNTQSEKSTTDTPSTTETTTVTQEETTTATPSEASTTTEVEKTETAAPNESTTVESTEKEATTESEPTPTNEATTTETDAPSPAPKAEETSKPKAAAGTLKGDAQRLAELLCKSQKLVEDALTAGDGMDAKLNEANQLKGEYEKMKKTCQEQHSDWTSFLKTLTTAVTDCGGDPQGL